SDSDDPQPQTRKVSPVWYLRNSRSERGSSLSSTPLVAGRGILEDLAESGRPCVTYSTNIVAPCAACRILYHRNRKMGPVFFELFRISGGSFNNIAISDT